MKNLKKIILPILIFFAGFMGHAQNYDCNNASMYKMQEVYNEMNTALSGIMERNPIMVAVEMLEGLAQEIQKLKKRK